MKRKLSLWLCKDDDDDIIRLLFGEKPTKVKYKSRSGKIRYWWDSPWSRLFVITQSESDLWGLPNIKRGKCIEVFLFNTPKKRSIT